MEVQVKYNKTVVVDYPGIVHNEQCMLSTLGGEDNVTKVYNDPVKRLDMKWRPKDVFCKPTCADRKPTHMLLLKVTKKKESNENEPGCLEAKVEGIAETVYKFESLCDFQYLAMNNKEEGSGYNSVFHDIVPCRDKQVKSDWLKHANCPLFLPSPIYSRMDRPVEYAYKDKPRSAKRHHTDPESAITLDRAKRPHFSKFHSFKSGDVPTEPFPQAVERLRNKAGYKIEMQNVEKIRKMFEERPLWTRVAIKDKTGISRDTLKHCLPLVAYYWETGPWRTMWCKYGFDPRKNPEAKLYQLIDFRLKGNSFAEINVKRSSTAHYNLPGTVVRGGTLVTIPTIRHSDLSDVTTNTEEQKDTRCFWKFQPDTVPSQRQFFYQLIDIEVPEVQDIVMSNDSKESQCTEKDGWCVPGYADKVRQVMMAKVTDILEKVRKEGGVSDVQDKPQWKDRTLFRPLYTNKGKSGPKHIAKTSLTLSKDSLEKTDHSKLNLSGNSDSSSESGSEGEEVMSTRELRTQVLKKDPLVDFSGLELSEEEEDILDSDGDPEYDPSKEPIT